MTSHDAGCMHVHEIARNSSGGKKKWESILTLAASLVTQPPKTAHMKKGSGIIVYNEQSQTLECGATNQIAPFAINVQSAQFIIK